MSGCFPTDRREFPGTFFGQNLVSTGLSIDRTGFPGTMRADCGVWGIPHGQKGISWDNLKTEGGIRGIPLDKRGFPRITEDKR